MRFNPSIRADYETISNYQFLDYSGRQKARNFLLKTDQNVFHIAYEIDFAEANYFTKAFVREYGLSTTELKKSFR